MTTAEAEALVERHGGIRAAARAIDMPFSSFYYVLKPAAKERKNATSNAYHTERYWNLTGLQLAAEQLRLRRHAALKRMAKRNQRRQEEAANG